MVVPIPRGSIDNEHGRMLAKVKMGVKHYRRLESHDGFLRGPIEKHEPGRMRILRERPINLSSHWVRDEPISDTLIIVADEFAIHHSEPVFVMQGNEKVQAVLHVYRQVVREEKA